VGIGGKAIMISGLAVFLCAAFFRGAEAAKLAFVDMAKVVKEYDKTKDAQARLEKEFDDPKGELKTMNEALEKQAQDLQAKKGLVTDAQFTVLKTKFEAQQNAFQEKYKAVQESLSKKQRDVMESLIEDIKQTIAEVAKAEKYEAVFDKEILLFGGEEITYKVLDLLNRKN
jgi:Skp family chaperone for outer membrane proteins